MENQQSLFDFAIEKMRERSVFKFYGDRKTPRDAVEAGARSLSSTKATQLRSQAFAKDDVVQELNSPTYCSEVDAYVPFYWAVSNYPESTFAAWNKRVSMAAALQKKQFVFQTTAQLYLKGALSVDEGDLVAPDHYVDELPTK
jgi:hypothetical protein|tara:strand:+ start:922 stop:1350 length:429 start_codon:yes stop_codon:yes gene_type:complete